MNINDLVEILADRNGVIRCNRDASGATVITVELVLSDKGIQSVGGDLKSVIKAAKDEYDRIVKNRDVVPLSTIKQK